MPPIDPAVESDLPTREPIRSDAAAAGDKAKPATPDPLLDPTRREGAEGFSADMPKWANPYKKQDPRHGLWKHGWKIACERAKAAAGAGWKPGRAA